MTRNAYKLLRKVAADEEPGLLGKLLDVAAENVAEKIEDEKEESSSSSSSSSANSDELENDQTVFIIDKSNEAVPEVRDDNKERKDGGKRLDSYLNLSTGKGKRDSYKTVKGILRMLP